MSNFIIKLNSFLSALQRCLIFKSISTTLNRKVSKFPFRLLIFMQNIVDFLYTPTINITTKQITICTRDCALCISGKVVWHYQIGQTWLRSFPKPEHYFCFSCVLQSISLTLAFYHVNSSRLTVSITTRRKKTILK